MIVLNKFSKLLACKELGLEEAKFTLYRVDGFEDPVYPLRRENSELVKSNVSSGDLLVLKSTADVPLEERLNLNIHVTMTGHPEDS